MKVYRAGLPGCSAFVRALDGVNLRVRSGEVVAIIGAAGAGKTTLLHCAAGRLRPDGGVVQRDDRRLLLVDDAPASDGPTVRAELSRRLDVAVRSGCGVLVAGRSVWLGQLASRVFWLHSGRLRPFAPEALSRSARVAERVAPLTPLPDRPSIR